MLRYIVDEFMPLFIFDMWYGFIDRRNYKRAKRRSEEIKDLTDQIIAISRKR